jgi:hypothetical protein
MQTSTNLTESEYNPLAFNFLVEDPKTLQSEKLEFRHTKHSFQRAAQRGINLKKVSPVLEYGESYFKQGLIYYILGENNIPKSLSKERKKLRNLVVIVAGDSNQVITCYRSNNPFKNIKTKSKRLGVKSGLA